MVLDITNKKAVQQFIDTDYKRAFGGTRNAVFDPNIDGDADYWTDQIMSGSLKAGDLGGHLDASYEATNDIQNDPGGVDSSKSITSQYATNPWLQNFGDIGSGATYETANKYGHATNSIQGISNSIGAALTAANTAAGVDDTNEGDNASNPYLNRIYNTVADSELGGGSTETETETEAETETETETGNNYLTMDDLTQFFTDRDAAAADTKSEGGMGDFMKFMMFMNMMRPQGMGGGSQYGYGGLNPGGVQSAYNPMDNMQGMMDSFKSLNSGLLN